MKTLRQFSAFIILIFFSLFGHCQELIKDTCFDNYILKKNGSPAFNNISKYWKNPTVATPDFNFALNPSPYYKVPKNFAGYEIPFCGIAYAGIIVYTKDVKHAGPNWREYIRIKLIDKLVKDQLYCLTMQVSLADTCDYAADGLSAYFSKNAIKYRYTTNMVFKPQIETIGGSIVTAKYGWTRICSFYKALGGESYLTIGNFKNDANTQLVTMRDHIKKSDFVAEMAYYYIGFVSLQPISAENECQCMGGR